MLFGRDSWNASEPLDFVAEADAILLAGLGGGGILGTAGKLDGRTDSLDTTLLIPHAEGGQAGISIVHAGGSGDRESFKNTGIIYTADFEEGTEAFVKSPTNEQNLWKTSQGRSADGFHSGGGTLYFGQNEGPTGGGNYNAGRVAGSVTSPEISFDSGTVNPTLSFRYFMGVEQPEAYDRATVSVSDDNGATFTAVATNYGTDNKVLNRQSDGWDRIEIALNDVTGFSTTNGSLRVRFEFDSIDAIANNFEGWYVDDIELRGYRTDDDIETGDRSFVTTGDADFKFDEAVSLATIDVDGDNASHPGESLWSKSPRRSRLVKPPRSTFWKDNRYCPRSSMCRQAAPFKPFLFHGRRAIRSIQCNPPWIRTAKLT